MSSPGIPDDTSTPAFPVDPSCKLLGPTALIVQAVMGVLVILSLVYKRHREKVKRPWRIWLFDVSKQVFGQMFVHGVNVLISDLGSHRAAGNACTFYFLNILIDTTLGVALIYIILRALTHILDVRLGLKGFESGQYGTPPSIKYWLRQAAVYVLSLTSMKLLVVGLFALYPGIFSIGNWLLSWTRSGDNETFQVIFTMGLFPIIMNILQFWLIDSIVKASESPTVALGASDDPRNSEEQDREPLFGAPSDDEDDDDDDTTRPLHDVENPRSRSYSPDETKHSTPKDDHKSVPSASGGSTPLTISDGGTSVAMHAYPPTGSITSTSGSLPREGSVSPASGGHKYKRSIPAPLSLQSAHQPAINSPDPSARPRPTPKSSRNVAESLAKSQPVSIATPMETEQTKEWAASWDDSDDWATRVGEDDWTGKRMGHKKEVLSEAWGPGSTLSPHHQQSVGAVGS